MGRINLDNITLVSLCGDARFLVGIIKAARQCMKYVDFKSVKILSNVMVDCPDIEMIKIPPLNKEKYCTFSLYELPKYIHTDFCLTFQGDGFVINPDVWDEKFLNYDYIGAPWVEEINDKDRIWKTKAENIIGNGGFSLRSQKFLHSAKTLEYNSKIQFRDDIPYEDIITPEDWFTCCYSYKQMTGMGVKFADIETAYKFSVEHPSYYKIYAVDLLSTYNSFGFHGSFNTAAMKLLEE